MSGFEVPPELKNFLGEDNIKSNDTENIYVVPNNDELRRKVIFYLDDDDDDVDKRTNFKNFFPISKWNTENIDNMSDLFSTQDNFNEDISKWNVSNVTNMNAMFSSAKEFNQDITKRTIIKVFRVIQDLVSQGKFGSGIIKIQKFKL